MAVKKIADYQFFLKSIAKAERDVLVKVAFKSSFKNQ
jgi:hypothetical protein